MTIPIANAASADHNTADGISRKAATGGGVTTATLRKLAEAGEIDPDERVVIYITGDGLKTLDAVADRVARHPIQPTVASFEAAVGEARLLA